MLLVGCLVSLVFAVLAARPRVTQHTVTLDDVHAGRANILFFGNFVKMSIEDYELGMQDLMRNSEKTYMNMVRDIYYLGVVLDRKFRLLRLSYNAFMVGLVTGVVLLLWLYLGVEGLG